MCIIVCKVKGSDFPSSQTISNCIEANPHGFSMVWNEPDGSLNNFKTMDPVEALAKYGELASTLDPESTAMIFHARIATHGSHKLENCHCWIERFEKKGHSFSIAFAHNGILGSVAPREDMTDSETFFRDILLPVLKASGWKTARTVANAMLGASRFAFMCDTGNVEMLGDFIKYGEPGAKGKCYYSNFSFSGSGVLFPSFRGERCGHTLKSEREPAGTFTRSRQSNFKSFKNK